MISSVGLIFSACHRYITSVLGIHCTHGFNRTGFLICVYLCRALDMSIDAAIDIFAKARPTGIYKQDYLNELVRKYGDGDSTIVPAPIRPDWCLSKWTTVCN